MTPSPSLPGLVPHVRLVDGRVEDGVVAVTPGVEGGPVVVGSMACLLQGLGCANATEDGIVAFVALEGTIPEFVSVEPCLRVRLPVVASVAEEQSLLGWVSWHTK